MAMKPVHVDARTCLERLKRDLDEIIHHARLDIHKIDDPRARVMLEMTAEVLTGLKSAFEHYEAGTETSFQQRGASDMPPNSSSWKAPCAACKG